MVDVELRGELRVDDCRHELALNSMTLPATPTTRSRFPSSAATTIAAATLSGLYVGFGAFSGRPE